jgi:hypothetical protein
MSFNRLTYDHCRYARELGGNTSILGYVLNEDRYEHPEKCHHRLGLLGGPSVSQVKGNLVDMESELLGITRLLSKCSTSKAKPLEQEPFIINDKTSPIDTTKNHLPTCQMFAYPSVQMPPPMNYPHCRR